MRIIQNKPLKQSWINEGFSMLKVPVFVLIAIGVSFTFSMMNIEEAEKFYTFGPKWLQYVLTYKSTGASALANFSIGLNTLMQFFRSMPGIHGKNTVNTLQHGM